MKPITISLLPVLALICACDDGAPTVDASPGPETSAPPLEASTPPDSAPARFRVWVLSDTHFDNRTLAGLTDKAGQTYPGYNWPEVFAARLDGMAGQYDLAVLTGDIVHWREFLPEMQAVERILGEKGVRDRFILIAGNHDTLHGTGDPLAGMYYVEHLTPARSCHFTRQAGNLLFVIVGDEGCYGPDSLGYGLCARSTWEWFDQTVAGNEDKIIVAGSHEHPCFAYPWNECLPYSDDFQQTLGAHDVALWLYGHTHEPAVKEIPLAGGRRTLFLNAGTWECSSRSCALRTDPTADWAPHRSLLLTFTPGSTEVALSRVIHAPLDETTPRLEGLGTRTLPRSFQLH